MPTEETSDPLGSLTEAEQQRVGTLLASVSTETLLHSLARLCQDNGDTRLIISALLRRIPSGDAPSADEPAGHDPVMPM